MDEALAKARALLENVTPLRFDCGRRCGAACCSPDEDGKGGMLLFPGEETLYDPLPEGFSIRQDPIGLLLVCSGRCDRALRPLSCMLFPLWIFEKEQGFAVRTDPRARGVCPLSHCGLGALSSEFIAAVRGAGELLLREEKHRRFLRETAGVIGQFSADTLFRV